MEGMVVSLFVCAVTGWNLLGAAQRGAIYGRSGTGWSKAKSPGLSWLHVTVLGVVFAVFVTTG